MSPSWLRPTRAIVDLDAIRHNIAAIAQAVAPAHLGVVVKADGYGHGALTVSRAVVGAGASWLMVATADEGVELRAAGLSAPILVLSRQRGAALEACVHSGLSVTVDGSDAIDEVAGIADRVGVRAVPLHLKIDTGMHRVGCEPGHALELARHITKHARLELAGVWTHFACADDSRSPVTERQLDVFVGVLDSMTHAGLEPGLVHASNSAGALGRSDSRLGLVRVGLAAWGVLPAADIGVDLDLRPVLRLESQVTAVRDLDRGEGVSYGHRYTTSERERIATVCIGYADGVRRDAGLRGVEVLIGGRRRPIRGTVTMDQLMVGVDRTVDVGDEVVLVGTQGADRITVSEVADRLGTIPYEVLVAIGPRVPRIEARSLTPP